MRILILTILIFSNTISFCQENNSDTCQTQPFEAYVDDKDVFSNVRASPNGEIILKINNELFDGCIVHIIDFENGWFKIDNLSGVSGYEMSSFEGWIHHSIVGAATTYDLDVLDVPNGKTNLGTIKGESSGTFKILEANCEWIKIKYNDLVGWVKSKDICGSPVTTCP